MVVMMMTCRFDSGYDLIEFVSRGQQNKLFGTVSVPINKAVVSGFGER